MKYLRKYWIHILILLVAAFLPFMGVSKFMLHVIIYAGIFSIGTISLNIIMGYAGQVSLAQGLFFGIGAYSMAILTSKTGLNFWLAMLLACLFTALIGALIGLPSFRTRGPYFVIVTLCFNFSGFVVIKNWDWLSGGVLGQSVRVPDLIAGRDARYYLVFACVLLSLYVMSRMSKSLEGLGLIAVRGNEPLADALGVNTYYTKMIAFTVSCFIAGLAGCLNAVHTGVVGPTSAHYLLSFYFIIYLLVGGAATFYGPLVGTFGVYIALEYMKDLGDYRFMIFGIILILVVYYFPRGLTGGFGSLWNRITAFRGRVEESA